LDDHTLNIINAVSGAFAAIGTVAAVVVALALAKRDEGLRLGIDVATGGIVVRGHGQLLASRFEILISIANLGRRQVQVTAVGWTLGYFRKQCLVQVFDPDPPRVSRPYMAWTQSMRQMYGQVSGVMNRSRVRLSRSISTAW
jgi:hypothetical protein